MDRGGGGGGEHTLWIEERAGGGANCVAGVAIAWVGMVGYGPAARGGGGGGAI